jgi:mono/diheme cytochrome c family protein
MGPIQSADLGITRLLKLFAALSVTLVLLLAYAPAQSYFTEWRGVQNRYNALAKKNGMQPIPVSIKQIYAPELEVADRCGSCHLAAAGEAPPIPGDALFAAHPPLPHDPRQMGCTPCHRGQGRATTSSAAHGNIAHFDQPLLPANMVEAGCGGCHSHIKTTKPDAVERGRTLFDAQCKSCHSGASALSYAGLHGFRSDWHAWHLSESANAQGKGRFAAGFAPLADDEIAAVEAFLGAQTGAPRLLAGKMLAAKLGCRGCHRIHGAGGDDGPDLSSEGTKAAADLDFSRVRGAHTTAEWLEEHFAEPARVSPGSKMPELELSKQETELLALYTLSLDSRPIPEAFAPRDRVRGMQLQERDFPSDGESLYGVFCSACHGAQGQGRKLQGQPAPAISNPDFLAVADDAFLKRATGEGRTGRRMPGWARTLSAAEIDAVVAFLRSKEPPPIALASIEAEEVSAELGDAAYATSCASCHGAHGEGTSIAPPLAAPDNVVNKADDRIYGTLTFGVQGTAMGSFRTLDAKTLRAVIAHVRTMPSVDVLREKWSTRPGDKARGAPLYEKHCARCHGLHGEGGEAPQLSSGALLSAISDGQLAATIIRGRAGTLMPGFGVEATDHAKLSADEVQDVVAHLRSLSSKANAP